MEYPVGTLPNDERECLAHLQKLSSTVDEYFRKSSHCFTHGYWLYVSSING